MLLVAGADPAGGAAARQRVAGGRRDLVRRRAVAFPGPARCCAASPIRNATTLLFILVVGLVYYFVPNAKVRFRDVWIGAFITGLLWKGALDGFSWYMRDMTRFTPRQRIDCRGRGVPGVGLCAGGDPAVRRGVHGRVRAPAPRPARGTAGGAGAARRTLECGLRELVGAGHAPDCATARMIASLNTGTSSGLREVIRLPSSTTGLST